MVLVVVSFVTFCCAWWLGAHASFKALSKRPKNDMLDGTPGAPVGSYEWSSWATSEILALRALVNKDTTK